MTESSIFDTNHNQHAQPGMMTNKPASGRGGALAFNPLHPSMELPPEQLIRLLGMESKKTRKHLKMQRSSRKKQSNHTLDTEKTRPSPDQQIACHSSAEEKSLVAQDSQKSQKSQRTADRQNTHHSPKQGAQQKAVNRQQRPESQQTAQPRHRMEYERNEPAAFDKQRPGWLLPSLVTGLVAGITVSVFLFWYQSPPVAIQKAPAPVVSSEPRNRKAPEQPPNGQLVKRKTAPVGTKTAPVPEPAQAVLPENDANWQVAIKAEQNRLRSAAEQRLTEQVTRMKVNRELAELQAPLAAEDTPATDTTLSAAGEPAFEQAEMNGTAASSTESLRSDEAPVAMIQADEVIPVAELETVPAVTPYPAVEPEGSGDMFEESAGFVDSFERDTASDVAPIAEPDSGSTIAPSAETNTTTAFTHTPEQDTEAAITPPEGDVREPEQSSIVTADENPSPAAEDSASF
jgi:hypothetical protein